VAIPYLLLVAGAVGLQYLQMSRLNARNAGAQTNPQAAMLQKYMPLIFGFIYLNVAAILNVYFIISSAIRILTQEILFRRGIVGGPPPAPSADDKTPAPKAPVADRTERAIPRPKSAGGSSGGAGQRSASAANGSNGKSRRPATTKAAIDAKATEKAPSNGNGRAANGNGSAGGTGAKRPPGSKGAPGSGTGRTRPKPSGNGSSASNGSNGSNGTSTTGNGAGADKSHPRSKAKRERKAR